MNLGLGTTSQQPGKVSHTSIQSAHLRIKQILRDVADFAEIGRAFDPYAFAGSVFTPLAQKFLELESFAGETDEQLAEAVLADPDILQLLPTVYAIRSLYEYEDEWTLATESLSSHHAARTIQEQVDQKFEALPSSFYGALGSCERLLFVGSGPLPTTAMALYRKFGRPVVCIDRDERANELARQYVAASEESYEVEFIEADLAALPSFSDFDCVVCAFLIGVGTTPQPLTSKSQFIRKVAGRIPPGIPFVLRSSQELGSLIYPRLDPDDFSGFEFVEYGEPIEGRVPYDKTFTVIRKLNLVNGGE